MTIHFANEYDDPIFGVESDHVPRVGEYVMQKRVNDFITYRVFRVTYLYNPHPVSKGTQRLSIIHVNMAAGVYGDEVLKGFVNLPLDLDKRRQRR